MPSVFGARDLGSSSALLCIHNGLEQSAGLPLRSFFRAEQSSCVGSAVRDVEAFSAGPGSPVTPLTGASSVCCCGFADGWVCTGPAQAWWELLERETYAGCCMHTVSALLFGL